MAAKTVTTKPTTESRRRAKLAKIEAKRSAPVPTDAFVAEIRQSPAAALRDWATERRDAHPIMKDVMVLVGIAQDTAIELRTCDGGDEILLERSVWLANEIGARLDGYIEKGLARAP